LYNNIIIGSEEEEEEDVEKQVATSLALVWMCRRIP
jgi:hypothetical protein